MHIFELRNPEETRTRTGRTWGAQTIVFHFHYIIKIELIMMVYLNHHHSRYLK